ncbi:hypothetical protein PhiCh1p18 [Natrialba phage PhiCh1]|uniref:Virus protein phiCh1-VP17 n=2 Tax=root TaxID=1 RepID=D3T2G5_NATMM|nr:hypothetical protein [Natrialba magadii]NP_665935.1 hypothetical protein PhiCh1p18 [Natrialba phage PhiCh1]YP_010078047.1 tail completion protein, type 1 [Natrialba phage PhiCh1]AAM88691.1 unknown [Natrialba phage PhiCh1]ADD07774.1 virus protein phiCh1-VP17 [Natrialba magadii ATCC 43099]ELY23021.1 hypothetical protein C500_21195 [Natrialba magadii ATCC 43099]QBJ01198.1 tail completion protein, type 1 [Natrialba phage PhiCh1]
MLTTAEEDRFEEALPLEGLEVKWDGESYEYDLDPFWTGGDAADEEPTESVEYPAIVFDWETQNQPELGRQPLNDLHSIDVSSDESVLTETKTAEVSDDLAITIAVEAAWDDNGVPPQARVTQLTKQIWRFLRFELDLNSEGENEERPMNVEVPDESSVEPVRVEHTIRAPWQIRFHHAERHEEEHNTVEEFEINITIE